MSVSSARERLGDALNRLLFRISPLCLVRYRYWRATGRWYNPHNPQNFDEKLLWLMLYWQHPLKSRCADKLAVRSYVEENGMGHLLPRLLGVFESAGEIDFGALPERFALKATHGCGFNIICRDRRGFDPEEAARKLDGWMKVDYSELAAELQYASIQPRIICEALVDDGSGKPVDDYKVYCFAGKVHCTMVCSDRTEAGAKYDFYDAEWNSKLTYCKAYVAANRSIQKPEAYETMVVAAERLSRAFPFVRVDFYMVNGQAVFGEMTFTPHGSIDPELTDLAQDTMGDLLTLPEKVLR